MKLLEEKILQDGRAINEDILRVDTFINHQVDPVLMGKCAREFASYFKGKGVTKIVTVESSGISPALLTALEMGVPLVILKKQPSKVLNDNLYQTMIASFTKGTNYELTLSRDVISENDHVVIIDDFLANGETVTGAVRLLRMAHATVAGVGILIEKAFQPGREKLEDAGFDVYSLARIGSMSKDQITFIR
ncbi:MAG: xanthine phosphoribosyltransferase [Lachnospiraceae bacterium]|nr:xanthine phosphoribosyltransferase [Lachnospiraceae bacterium]